jgi:hypothetical protein
MKNLVDKLKTEDQLRFAQQVADTAIRMGVDPRLAVALAFRESSFNPEAVGTSGEIGLMQVKPSTAKDMGFSIEDLRDPSKNIEIGLTYLKQNLDKFGYPEVAAAAYNAGPNHPFFSDADKPLPASTEKYLADIRDLGGFEPTPAPEPEPPLEQPPAQASEDDFNANKMRMLMDVGGAGAGAIAAKVADVGKGVIGGTRDLVRGSRSLPGALSVMQSMQSAGAPAPSAPAAPQSGLRPTVGGPAGPVGGPASSGAKWLQNWGNIPKEGFSGGVPEAAAQYNKMKPQGQIMQGLAKKGLLTPQPVQPGVFTGGQLSISGQPPAPPPPPPPPGPLSQAAGAVKQGVGAVLRSPLASGALGGLSMAESAQEADRQIRAQDTTGAAIAGAGIGGGAMQIFGSPRVKAIGALVSAASPLTLYLRENLRKQTPMPDPTEQEMLEAQRPAFGMYPQMPRPQLRPRVPALGTNLPPVEFMR